MNIPIKLKASEKAAIEKLNKAAPQLYQEKNPGFRWAASQAAMQKNIEWIEISKRHLDDKYDTDTFRDDESSISHLALNDTDFEILLNQMNKAFGVAKSVQKAFLARSIIKWGLYNLDCESRMTLYYSGIQDKKASEESPAYSVTGVETLNNVEALKSCVELFCSPSDSEKTVRAQQEIVKVLMNYIGK